MKRPLVLLVCLIAILLCGHFSAAQVPINVAGLKSGATPTPTPFDACFNFRSSSGFVTDISPCVYVLKTDTYTGSPIRGGFTFGWVIENTVFDVDRNNANDPRLAGINYVAGTATAWNSNDTYFRVDLPATGTYVVHLAMGDSFGQSNMNAEIRDTTTDLSFAVSAASTSGNHYLDATGADLTNATWPGSEIGVSKSFGTTQLRLYPGSHSTSDVTTIAHLRIVRIS